MACGYAFISYHHRVTASRALSIILLWIYCNNSSSLRGVLFSVHRDISCFQIIIVILRQRKSLNHMIIDIKRSKNVLMEYFWLFYGFNELSWFSFSKKINFIFGEVCKKSTPWCLKNLSWTFYSFNNSNINVFVKLSIIILSTKR